jgi:hypothetical protein
MHFHNYISVSPDLESKKIKKMKITPKVQVIFCKFDYQKFFKTTQNTSSYPVSLSVTIGF